MPTIDTANDFPFHVARALSAVDSLTGSRSGWQPSSRAQPDNTVGVPRGMDFVAATRSLWDSRGADAPVLVQTDADPLWMHVAPDVVIF